MAGGELLLDFDFSWLLENGSHPLPSCHATPKSFPQSSHHAHILTHVSLVHVSLVLIDISNACRMANRQRPTAPLSPSVEVVRGAARVAAALLSRVCGWRCWGAASVNGFGGAVARAARGTVGGGGGSSSGLVGGSNWFWAFSIAVTLGERQVRLSRRYREFRALHEQLSTHKVALP